MSGIRGDHFVRHANGWIWRCSPVANKIVNPYMILHSAYSREWIYWGLKHQRQVTRAGFCSLGLLLGQWKAVIFWLLCRTLWHSTAPLLLLLLVERPLIPTEYGVRAGISSDGIIRIISASVLYSVCTEYEVRRSGFNSPARSTRNHRTITAPQKMIAYKIPNTGRGKSTFRLRHKGYVLRIS